MKKVVTFFQVPIGTIILKLSGNVEKDIFGKLV